MDTAGNIIQTFKLCRCGFTGGCSYCCPKYPQYTEHYLPRHIYEEEITDEDKKEFYKKNFSSGII